MTLRARARGGAPLEPFVPVPRVGRTFVSTRRVRLGDMDADGRVRLDAVARFLQDAAIDDVHETGWGWPDHLWVLRRIRVHVGRPLLEDRTVTLRTWCSSTAAVAAGRRWSLAGDRGGSVEVDSVWIHLGPDARPARLEGFVVYAESTEGRRASTRLELPDPPEAARRVPWPLRASDVDLFGHVNNAVYWQAVEELQRESAPDPRLPYRAFLDYRDPLDVGDALELAAFATGGRLDVGFAVGGRFKAVARIESVERRWRTSCCPRGVRR